MILNGKKLYVVFDRNDVENPDDGNPFVGTFAECEEELARWGTGAGFISELGKTIEIKRVMQEERSEWIEES